MCSAARCPRCGKGSVQGSPFPSHQEALHFSLLHPPLTLVYDDQPAHCARKPNLTHLKSVPGCVLCFMLVPARRALLASGPGDSLPLWRQHDSAIMHYIHMIILQLSEFGAIILQLSEFEASFALLYLSTVSRVY